MYVLNRSGIQFSSFRGPLMSFLNFFPFLSSFFLFFFFFFNKKPSKYKYRSTDFSVSEECQDIDLPLQALNWIVSLP